MNLWSGKGSASLPRAVDTTEESWWHCAMGASASSVRRLTLAINQPHRSIRGNHPLVSGVPLVRPMRAKFRESFDEEPHGSRGLPRSTTAELELPMELSAEAILADGTRVGMKASGCKVECFGRMPDTQIAINDGEYALLGTILLAGRCLEIDYANGNVPIN